MEGIQVYMLTYEAPIDWGDQVWYGDGEDFRHKAYSQILSNLKLMKHQDTKNKCTIYNIDA